jgi:multidrug efflux pump subunit AcrA (membrane-fusion protein)
VAIIVVLALAIFIGCSACNSRAERIREAQRIEAERLAAEEAARLAEEEAARLAAEEAARLEAERLAAEEAARLAAEEALRRAQEEEERLAAQRRRQASGSDRATVRTNVGAADPNNPWVGTWANNNGTIVLRFNANGTVNVLNFEVTDQYVQIYFRTNRALTGGGFNDVRNPKDYNATYTGSGSYTINKDSVALTLALKNTDGVSKDIKHNTVFQFESNLTQVRLTRGIARKYIIDEATKKPASASGYVQKSDQSEFVTQFYRQ